MQFKFFPVGKISQSCITVLKTQLKRHTHEFFGLIKSRFSEPELFLIYTRVSKTTPVMVINFTDNDDIQRYSPFLSPCVCFLFEHSVLHNVGWPLPILPIMTHVSIMGLEGKGRLFGNMQGEGRLSWKEKKPQSKQKIDMGAQNIRDCGDNYNSFWPLTGQNVFL